MAGVIAYRNIIDRATLSQVGNTVLPGYPLDNVKTRQLAETTRLSNDNPLDIRLTFAFPERLNTMALLGLNFSPNVNAGMSVQYSSNGTTWTDVPNPRGGGTLIDDADLGIAGKLCVVFDDIAARYWRLRAGFDAADAYRSIGRVYASLGLVLNDKINAGWSLSFQDSGVLDKSKGDQYVDEPGVIAQVLSLRLEKMPDTLTMFGFNDGDLVAPYYRASMQGLMMLAGKTGDVLALPRLSTSLWVHRLGIYGHVESIWSIDHLTGERYASALKFVQER